MRLPLFQRGAWQRPLALGARWAAGALAVIFLALYAAVALLRMRYPFPLEWLEGAMVGHVARLLEGRPLYVPPGLDFTPFIYNPLYYGVSAAATAVTGLGFFPLRLVSFLASLAVFALLFRLAARETGSPYAGLLAAGLMAALFPACGGWYDLARTDSLYLALLLGAAYRLRFARGAGGAAFAGVLAALAFFAKQTAMVMAVPLALYAAFAFRGRARWAFPAAFAAAVALPAAAMTAASKGWYFFYAFGLSNQQPLVPSMLYGFWIGDLARIVPVAAAAAAVYALYRLEDGDRRAGLFHVFFLGGAVGTAWLGRLHFGGFANALMPAYAAIALAFGAAADRLARAPDDAPGGADAARGLPVPLLAALLAAVQFAALWYDPRELLPTRADRAAGDALVERLRGIEGEVLVSRFGHLPRLAGKRVYASPAAWDDLLRSDRAAERERLEGEVRAALKEHRFAAIVTDPESWLAGLLAEYGYRNTGPAVPDRELLVPVCGGWRTRDMMYVPDRAAPPTPGTP